LFEIHYLKPEPAGIKMVLLPSILYLTIQLLVVQSVPDGWRMTDRFSGFRFEIHGDELHSLWLKELIQGMKLAFSK